MHKSQFIKGFITCWTLVRTLTKYISVFFQHVEPLFALVWLPSAFVERAAAALPVGNKKCQADEQKYPSSTKTTMTATTTRTGQLATSLLWKIFYGSHIGDRR